MADKYNALRVSDHFEKIYIDFETYGSLLSSVHFSGIKTIVNNATRELSRTLGFDVAGFVDPNDIGAPDLAIQVASDESITSDLILCAVNEDYRFLPLDEEQLDMLYDYLSGVDPVIEEESIADIPIISSKNKKKEEPEKKPIEKKEEPKEEKKDECLDLLSDELAPYILRMSVECEWPDIDNVDCKFDVCVPLFALNRGLPFNLPYFNIYTEVTGFNKTKEVCYFETHFGETEKHGLKVGQYKTIYFTFNEKVEKGSGALRSGKVKFSFEKHDFTVKPTKGVVAVKERLDELTKDEEVFNLNWTLTNPKENGVDKIITNGGTGNDFHILFTERDGNFLLIHARRKAYGEGNENNYVNTYIPLDRNGQAIYSDNWYTNDEEFLFEQILLEFE